MSFFNKLNTIESIDNKISDLRKQRQTLLERRDALAMDAVTNPERIDQKEWTRVDSQLIGIAPLISQLEQQRHELEQKSRRKEYDQCMADFKRERALAEKIGQAQRREVIRANLLPGQYMRLASQQAEIVSGYQQRCLDLLRTLNMNADELASARDSLRFSRLDIGAMDINAHHALVAEMLPQIIAELEAKFSIKLSVEAIDG